MMKRLLLGQREHKVFLKNGRNLDKTTMLSYVEMAEMLKKVGEAA
jgi:hypothetical protein